MPVTTSHIDEVLQETADEGNPSLQIAPVDSLPPGLPPDWMRSLSSANARLEVLRLLWSPMADRLPAVLELLEDSLQGVGILTTDTRPASIIYFFTLEEDEEPFYYRGFLPATQLPDEVTRLPQDFLQIYQVHDGWTDQNDFMGPLPSLSCHYLGADPNQPAGKFFVVFEDGGGAFLGYDFMESPPVCYTIWPDDPPEVVPDIWAELDQWISNALEDDLLPHSE